MTRLHLDLKGFKTGVTGKGAGWACDGANSPESDVYFAGARQGSLASRGGPFHWPSGRGTPWVGLPPPDGLLSADSQVQQLGMVSGEIWGPGCGQLLLEPKCTSLSQVRGDSRASHRVCGGLGNILGVLWR